MAFTIEVYRNMLRVNKHRLDDELEVQAETQERISSQLARLNSLMLEAKKTLDQAEVAAVWRVKDGDAKIGVQLAEKEARRDPAYITAWKAWSVARQEYEEWLGLYEAWKSRGYQLRTLADLHGDQYFAIDSASGRAVQRPGQEDGMRSRLREASAAVATSRPAPEPTPPVRRRVSITS